MSNQASTHLGLHFLLLGFVLSTVMSTELRKEVLIHSQHPASKQLPMIVAWLAIFPNPLRSPLGQHQQGLHPPLQTQPAQRRS